MNPTRRLPDAAPASPSRGQPTPPLTRHPSEEGTYPHPLPGGVAEGRGGFLLRQAKRWVACRRGVVALENALATIPLVLCLTGMFEIVQTIFAGDVVKRASYRVARANALASTPASDATAMKSRITQAIDDEVGSWLDYDLLMNADCPDPSASTTPTADYCVSARIEVYSSPLDMTRDPPVQAIQDDTVGYGGGTGDMVVVRLHVKPQSASVGLKQALFGATGPQFRAVAVMRNEERIP